MLTECQEAGIPVILVDRGIDASAGEDLYTTMIASDHVWAGEQAAIVMNDLLGGAGKVVELEGTVGASAAVQRKQGFDDYIANNCPDIEILDSQTGDFTRAMGKEVMESFLKSYSDIDAVFCHNDDMALGAIDALKAKSISRMDWPAVVGIDGTDVGLEAVRSGEMIGTVYNDKEGQAAAMLELAYTLSTNGDIKEVDMLDGNTIRLPYIKISAKEAEAFTPPGAAGY